jgi:hypothetical protein
MTVYSYLGIPPDRNLGKMNLSYIWNTPVSIRHIDDDQAALERRELVPRTLSAVTLIIRKYFVNTRPTRRTELGLIDQVPINCGMVYSSCSEILIRQNLKRTEL